MSGNGAYSCRGCGGTCCTGVPGLPCTCPPPQDDDTGQAMSTFLGALREHGSDAVEMDGSRYFQCPAHDDRRASLTVRQGEQGVLVKCHAGCETGEVLAALSLTTADLFDKGGKREQA